jgi:CRP-like cAMP-binding protein
MEEVYFNAGQAILIEGQDGRAMYIMVSGQVSVHLKDQEVAHFKLGNCFGEMSFLTPSPAPLRSLASPLALVWC